MSKFEILCFLAYLFHSKELPGIRNVRFTWTILHRSLLDTLNCTIDLRGIARTLQAPQRHTVLGEEGTHGSGEPPMRCQLSVPVFPASLRTAGSLRLWVDEAPQGSSSLHIRAASASRWACPPTTCPESGTELCAAAGEGLCPVPPSVSSQPAFSFCFFRTNTKSCATPGAPPSVPGAKTLEGLGAVQRHYPRKGSADVCVSPSGPSGVSPCLVSPWTQGFGEILTRLHDADREAGSKRGDTGRVSPFFLDACTVDQ